MPLFTVTAAERADILARSRGGESLRSIAASYGCAPATLSKRVLQTEPGYAPLPKGRARAFTDEQRAEILAAYEGGESVRSIGARYGCSGQTVHQWVIRPSHLFAPGEKKQRYTPAQKREMVTRYEAGESLGALGRAFGCEAANVRYVLKRRGVTIRPPGREKPSPETLALVRERREAGASHLEIANELGVRKHTVLTWCRQMGLPRDPSASGPEHPSWRGGRYVKDGYVLVWVDPTDPMASMAWPNGYVPEHRLVMARWLGRPLRSDETVHHRGPDKQDNRLEMLQLRQGAHGKGIRAECLDCGSLNIGFPEL